MFKNVLKMILKGQRIHQFQEMNEHPELKFNCIYAVNHSCKWDGQYLMEIIPGEFSFLAGKDEIYRSIWTHMEWNNLGR